MPVRNAMPYLDAAVRSILDQTFGAFELVIGDDASDDGSSERVAHWASHDPRIRHARRDSPSGPAGSSNWVVEMSRGRFVARMDADDLAASDRLAKQFAVLQDRPQAAMVGSLWHGIDTKDVRVRPPDYAGLLGQDPFSRPFSHGSVMFRRSAFDRIGGYRRACDYWEDTDLFFRMARVGEILVMPEPLYSYRYTPKSNRLQIAPAELERQLALRKRCRDAARAGGEYESVLADSAGIGAEPLPPVVFQNRASIEMWSGARSHMLFEWLARGSRSHLLREAKPIAFLAGALLAPRLLRFILAVGVRLANRRARSGLDGPGPVRWQPDLKPIRARR